MFKSLIFTYRILILLLIFTRETNTPTAYFAIVTLYLGLLSQQKLFKLPLVY